MNLKDLLKAKGKSIGAITIAISIIFQIAGLVFKMSDSESLSKGFSQTIVYMFFGGLFIFVCMQ